MAQGMNVHALKRNPLLCGGDLIPQESSQHSAFDSLVRALQLLQLLFGEEPVTLGMLCRDESLWERLPCMIQQWDNADRATEFLCIDWGLVHTELKALYAIYCRFGPLIEEVIQDLVGALLFQQIASPGEEVLCQWCA